jgi:hypothetical protein
LQTCASKGAQVANLRQQRVIEISAKSKEYLSKKEFDFFVIVKFIT